MTHHETKEGHRLVIPGEVVGASEEYVSGEFTYEKDGSIYSAVLGELHIDPKDKVVKVNPLNPPNTIRTGSIVIGMVTGLRSSMAIVDVQKVEGTERQITGDTNGTLQVSKVQESYTKDIRDEFHVGDFIRARVMQVNPSLQLTTAGQNLGVIRGLCSRCRAPMVKKGRDLYCEPCDRTETRKAAADYA